MLKKTAFNPSYNSAIIGHHLQVNQVLDARYQITNIIRDGEQNGIYQAYDLHTSRMIVIKAIQSQHEATLLSALSHPVIPTSRGCFTDNEQTYFVRDYIQGSDLDNIVSQTRTISISRVLAWAIALCDVLQYLHNNDIVFCDVKPANIIIDTNDQVHLIDFDIAKQVNSKSQLITYGTEGYAAPEQYKGQATPQSDIYSLGATLHHILTRQDPRQSPPFSFFMRPIPAFNNNVPSTLIQAIEQAVEVNPMYRFRTCTEMKHALTNIPYNITR